MVFLYFINYKCISRIINAFHAGKSKIVKKCIILVFGNGREEKVGVKAVFFGAEHDYKAFMDTVRALPELNSLELDCKRVDDYDEFRHLLVDVYYDLIIVAANGAHGMEVCIGARKIRQDTYLFWFSDDKDFGPQSYRLNCTYFATKPVPDFRMVNAFQCCGVISDR